MRKLKTTAWMSLDVYVSGPDDDMSFVSVGFNDQVGNYESAFVFAADTMILGRTTYESFAGAWPGRATDPDTPPSEKVYADALNSMEKYVYSTTMQSADWSNSTLLSSVDAAFIKELKARPGKDIIIYGSVSVVRALSALNLIDEYQLLIYPRILGGGKRYFEGVDDSMLSLESSKQYDTGIMELIYTTTQQG